jgi:hypothetical protein
VFADRYSHIPISARKRNLFSRRILPMQNSSFFLRRNECRTPERKSAVAGLETDGARRQPFLSDEFSVSAVNERLRQDEHHVLMYQQCG